MELVQVVLALSSKMLEDIGERWFDIFVKGWVANGSKGLRKPDLGHSHSGCILTTLVDAWDW